jgi:hypothetical protein
MAQAVSRRPLTAAARVHGPGQSVGFVVDKVALGQVFLRVLRLSLVNIFQLCAPHSENLKKNSFIPSFHLATDKKGAVQVRRQSHPHNQKTRMDLIIARRFA